MKATNKIMQWTLMTNLFVLVMFLVNAAIINIGSAIMIENIPAEDVAITSGAPSSFKKRGTTA